MPWTRPMCQYLKLMSCALRTLSLELLSMWWNMLKDESFGESQDQEIFDRFASIQFQLLWKPLCASLINSNIHISDITLKDSTPEERTAIYKSMADTLAKIHSTNLIRYEYKNHRANIIFLHILFHKNVQRKEILFSIFWMQMWTSERLALEIMPRLRNISSAKHLDGRNNTWTAKLKKFRRWTSWSSICRKMYQKITKVRDLILLYI